MAEERGKEGTFSKFNENKQHPRPRVIRFKTRLITYPRSLLVALHANNMSNESHDDDEDTGRLVEEVSSSSDPDPPLPIHETNIPRLCCALLASITTGGTTYAFGLYGSALKKTLHLTQGQLDTISSANFCAGLLSWVPGMFVDRYGTRLGISMGGISGALSLMTYWLVSKGHIQFSDNSVVVVILSALGVVIFLSCALITGAVFKIITCTCGAGTKGSAVGVAKGYVGLGAGAYACLFESIRQPTTSDLDFLPMAAFFFIVAAAIPSWIFLPDKQNERTVPDVLTPLHFRVLYTSLILLALLIVASSLAQLYAEGHSTSSSNREVSPNYMMAGTVIFVWISPIVAQLYLPQKSSLTLDIDGAVDEEEHPFLRSDNHEDNQAPGRESGLENEKHKHKHPPQHTQSEEGLDGNGNERGSIPLDNNVIEQHGDSAAESVSENENEDEDDGRQTAVVTENKNLYQMLQASSAWLMLWTSTILVGGGTVETNNMGQMVESLGFAPVVTSASLALFSVAQSAGRVLTGAISESALNWNTRSCGINNGVPRPFFLVVGSIAGVIAHTILAVSTDQATFVFGIALSGLAFGSVWPMLVLIVGELFGTANLAANYMFYDGFTSAAGTFLLSKIVAQEVYESHIDSHHAEGGDGVTCYGQQCFQLTHVVIAMLSLTCIVTSLIMQYTTRHVYNKSTLHRH
jgi:hypothetical protein